MEQANKVNAQLLMGQESSALLEVTAHLLENTKCVRYHILGVLYII